MPIGGRASIGPARPAPPRLGSEHRLQQPVHHSWWYSYMLQSPGGVVGRAFVTPEGCSFSLLGGMKQTRKRQSEPAIGIRKSTRQRRLVQQTLVTAAGGGGGRAAAAAVGSNKQLQPEPADAPQLHELRVVSVRQAVRGGSFSASFERQYAGWAVRMRTGLVLQCSGPFATPFTQVHPAWRLPPLQVFNVTSKSQDAGMVQLSPFYCHNGIPVRAAAWLGWLVARSSAPCSERQQCRGPESGAPSCGCRLTFPMTLSGRCLACQAEPPAAWSASGSASR